MNRLLIIAYELALWALTIVFLPALFYQWLFYKKYRRSLLERFGLRSFSLVKKDNYLIWIHAVSVGETKAVVALAKELKKKVMNCQLIISSITETGHAEAKRSLPFADRHVYLPFDFYFLVRRLLSKASPDLVIVCESDFWYNFLRVAKKKGAFIALVNGKLSQRSTDRFSRFSFFSNRLFDLFDAACVQNSLYQTRFIQAGMPSDRLVATGNLKLDEEYPQLSHEEAAQWRRRLGVSPEQIVLTIGSTHAPEEEIFIKILKEIWRKNPELKVILAPRHPERFKEVETLLQKEGVSVVSFTNIVDRTGQNRFFLSMRWAC